MAASVPSWAAMVHTVFCWYGEKWRSVLVKRGEEFAPRRSLPCLPALQGPLACKLKALFYQALLVVFWPPTPSVLGHQ